MLNPNATAFRNKAPPAGDALAFEVSDYLGDTFQQISRDLPQLLGMMKEMQKTLERTRTAYNKAIQDRDNERTRLVEVEGRLGEVQRVVQRYAGVNEPVVASDGFTYEKQVIKQYLTECHSNESHAYSQQTKEVLTDTLVPNQSLKKLVEMLKVIKGTEVKPATKATAIPPFAGGGAADDAKKQKGIHANDLEANLGPTNAATPSKANEAKPDAAAARGAKKEEPVVVASGKEGAGRGLGQKGPKGGESLHPCIRVYGYCNYKEGCAYANYPFDACLNNIKGKCRFGDGCKELHVNPKDPKYVNPRASNPTQAAGTTAHSGAAANRGPPGSAKDSDKPKDKNRAKK